MCNPMSGVLTKDGVFWSRYTDSHEDIITEYGLAVDGTRGPNIVRFEILPPDVDNVPLTEQLNLDEWTYMLDERSADSDLPEWYTRDVEAMEARARTALKAWHTQKVITTKHEAALRSGEYYVGGEARLSSVRGTTIIRELAGSARIGALQEHAYVQRARGKAVIVDIVGQGHVHIADGHVEIECLTDGGRVDYLISHAKCDCVQHVASIGSVEDEACVGVVKDTAYIGVLHSGTVNCLTDSAVLRYTHGGTVHAVEGAATICSAGRDTCVRGIRDYARVLARGADGVSRRLRTTPTASKRK